MQHAPLDLPPWELAAIFLYTCILLIVRQALLPVQAQLHFFQFLQNDLP